MEKGDPLPPCEGRLIRAHLIPQQLLHRRGLEPGDPATYRLSCGGISGLGGHHGLFDQHRLEVPFRELPDDTVAFAIAYDLIPHLERRFR
jgi:hypothetical protein